VNPFTALGLPADPHLTDEQVRAAWRTIAAATHPDRPDGGNVERYTAAATSYAQLRTGWGRSEGRPGHRTALRPRPWRTGPGPARHEPAPRRPAVAVGLAIWFVLTGRGDLAPPPGR